MSAIGLRVGPFEIDDEVRVPVPGNWFRAHRAGQKRRQPSEVLVRMTGPAPTNEQLSMLQYFYQTLKGLDDARIPSALAFYEGTGAMALVANPGYSLARLLPLQDDGRLQLSSATLFDLSIDVLEALQHAHSRGHTHGRLSPHMITMTKKGNLWLWGFGEANTTKADPQWLSPEQARSEPASVAADQWSLGALIGGLVLGRAPWSSEEPAGEAKVGNCDAFVAEVSRSNPSLGRIITRMMSIIPTERYPSLGPVHQEMLALARKTKGTSQRRGLDALLESAENAPFRSPTSEEIMVARSNPEPGPARSKATPLPDEDMRVVAPEIDLAVPVAIVDPESASAQQVSENEDSGSDVEVEVEWTAEEEVAPTGGESSIDSSAVPNAAAVFQVDQQPAEPALDAAPAPQATQLSRPVPLTFHTASEGGGAKTVVPHTDPGTEIGDVEEDDEEGPTVLYTKEMAEQLLNGSPTDVGAPVLEKPSQAPPVEPAIPITRYAPWIAAVGISILLLFTLINILW